MYEVIVPHSVKRDLKKLDRAVAREIVQRLGELANNHVIHIGTRENFYSELRRRL